MSSLKSNGKTKMERANSLILHCSESNKLYLAITGYKILLRCEKIRNTLESCLSLIQNMVHLVMVAQISRIVDDLKAATFTLESSEDEARIILLTLIHQDRAASDSANISELKALKLAALRLHITSQMTILIEKRSLRKLLSKIHDTDPNREKILKYLLYLLNKYGKSIRGYRMASIVSQHDNSLSQSIKPVPNVENSGGRSQVDVFDTPEPPEEFNCPLSARLMYDLVIIANGQTFERVW
ncbi:U-box domain-containing protein 6-like [Camellia sinensis]|uniref:U-box domain-containing protein 6-like n=1 Tax=Camellia sinensis TaxID=4442 RepID=UPI00103582C3|nr:U-box domain-containing protein 6-like [Camellia sinensis]